MLRPALSRRQLERHTLRSTTLEQMLVSFAYIDPHLDPPD